MIRNDEEVIIFAYRILGEFLQGGYAKSISKVAKEIHISQSALSQQILKLENDFNSILLERSNKGVKLTEKGKSRINIPRIL